MLCPQIQCVVVLYKNTLLESSTVRSLIDYCTQHDGFAQRISLLVYDNSPLRAETNFSGFSFGVFEYRHDTQNGGLAAAYNCALSIARSRKLDWLLLLDQDTFIEVDFLSVLMREICNSPPTDVCAIVPKLARNGIVLSPQVVGKLRNYPIDPKALGLYPKPLAVLNSGACIRVRALVDVGGFPQKYWLDYLDHIVFHRLQATGCRIVILDVVIQHHLSFMNLEVEMSIQRYTDMLSAEWMFVRETGWGGGTFIHRLRLLKRSMNHLISLRDKNYADRVLRAVFSRR
jgi:GT2 family glycosyltransferase